MNEQGLEHMWRSFQVSFDCAISRDDFMVHILPPAIRAYEEYKKIDPVKAAGECVGCPECEE